MKKLYTTLILFILTIGLFAQSGTVNLKYPTIVPALRVGGSAKVRLDSIVQNADTIKFYNGGTELKSNGAGIWTGTGIRLDTTLARVTLRIDQVPNLSQAVMFNDANFTGDHTTATVFRPATDGGASLGIYGNGWSNLFMSRGSRIYFDSDTTFGKLYFDYGDLHLDAHLDLGDNDLFLNGGIGSDDRKVLVGKFRYLTVDSLLSYSIGTADTVIRYGYFDSLSVNSLAISGNIGGITLNSGTLTLTGADALTFGTSGTTSLMLPTSGILYSSSNNIIPASSSIYTLGSTSMPFNSLYLSGGAINFNNGGGTIAYSSGDDDFYIGGAGIQLLTGDLGRSLAPVNKGWFTDLDIANRPTVGASPLLLGEDLKTINGEPIVGTGNIVITGSEAFTIEADSILADSTKYSVYKDGEIIPPDIPDGYTDDPTDLFPEIHAFAGDTANYPVPDKIGDLFINTATSKVYVSVSTSRGGWVILNMILLLFYYIRRRRK